MTLWPLLLIGLAAVPSPEPIPLELVNSHLFVRARLNGVGGLWLLDTGANLTVITPRTATKAACKDALVRAGKDPYGITRFVTADSLQVGGSTASLVAIGVIPKLADKVLRNDGVFIDGILGYDWLKRYRLEIDYRKRTLTLASGGKPAKSTSRRAVIPLEVTNGVPLVPVTINGGPMRKCLIDTGANVVNIRWDLALASGIKEDDPNMQAGPRVAGLTASENTRALILDRLVLGKVTFANVPVSFYQDSHVPWLFGKIGNALFQSFRLTLDPANRQMVLER